MTQHTDKIIIWALDAFGEKSLQTKGIKLLKTLSSAFNIDVEPVYVLSSEQVQVHNSLYPNWAINYEKASEENLNRFVEQAGFKRLRKAKVLVATTESLRGATDELIKYSKSHHARLIFTNTHSYEGISRFFLGSFTETLLLQSKFPILVSNPTTEIPNKIQNILFPTDFLNDSRKGLEDAVELAKNLNAKLTFYHKTVTPLYLNFPEDPFYSVYTEDLNKMLHRHSQSWLSWAKDKGVNCELVMDKAPEIGTLGKSVIAFAEKNEMDLICVVTKSSAVGAALLGSTARYLARHSHCPVWVHHS